jgi:electron transfer flavoprotein beta subunit
VSRAKGKISDFDRNAIEEAVLLVERLGGTVDALTYGTPAAKQSLKDVLSRGPNKVYWIQDPAAEKADAHVIATVLAGAIRRIGSYDLIICGEGSSDSYNQQMASRLAATLDLPAVTFTSQITSDNGTLKFTRKLDDCTEVATVSGPAVVSVLGEINHPRIPGLKQVLGASKKPSEEIKLADLGLSPQELTPRAIRKSVKGFVMSRKNVIFKDGDAAHKVAQLVASLAKEGLS